MIEVAFRHRAGEHELDIAFRSDRRVVALFGPSGSGKSSTLNVIAGLTRPGDARIVVDNRILADTTAGVWVKPHRRRIGYVFQEARLFPHLTVRQNLLYGRLFTPRGEPRHSPDAIFSLLALHGLLERWPRHLSGGERQRVAIGRALLASPRLMLMDEPLASLDQARKDEILPYIERLAREVAIPIVYVSHTRSEIERIDAEIVHVRAGRVVGSEPA